MIALALAESVVLEPLRLTLLLCAQGSYGSADSDERLRLASVRGAPPDRKSSMSPSSAHAPATALWNPHAAISAAASPGPSSEEGEDNVTEIYRLSIVRLADAEHAELAYLNASLSSNQSMVVCGAVGHAAGVTPSARSVAAVSGAVCTPGTPMWLNVTHDVDWVSPQIATCRACQATRPSICSLSVPFSLYSALGHAPEQTLSRNAVSTESMASAMLGWDPTNACCTTFGDSA